MVPDAGPGADMDGFSGPADPADRTLITVLADARGAGFLGPGPLAVHLDHARAMAGALPEAPTGLVADLGTGGGVPGLVLATVWSTAELLLIESNLRRARFLQESTVRLGMADRVTVLALRAEDVGRQPACRGRCDVVTARGFGPPAVTAECGAPLLAIGGVLLVAEPPEPRLDRWPDDGLALLGLAGERRAQAGLSFTVLRQQHDCPDRYPRRVGVPAKRPLWPVPRETS